MTPIEIIDKMIEGLEQQIEGIKDKPLEYRLVPQEDIKKTRESFDLVEGRYDVDIIDMMRGQIFAYKQIKEHWL